MCLAQRLLCGRCVVLLATMMVVLVVSVTLVLKIIFQNAIAADGYKGHGTKKLW